MKNATLFFVLMLIISVNSLCFTQSVKNLVPNGDFETLLSDSLLHDYLPVKTFYQHMKSWETPSQASTDVLNPRFWEARVAPPKTGKNAIGMVVNTYFAKGEKKIQKYAEYAQCELVTSLKIGTKYLVQFDISGSMADSSAIPLVESPCFGIHFQNKTFQDYNSYILPLSPQVQMSSAVTYEWQTVRQEYTPSVEQTHLIAGFFCPETNLKGVYFGMDNISVIEVSGAESALTAYLSFLGEEVVLSNVLFSSNSATLLPSSVPELEIAAEWLLENTEYVIEIQGHTDSDGEPSENLKLSEARAKSVETFLLKKGVPAYQIAAVGYGESSPLTANTTAEGRAMNRRVALKKVKILSTEDLYTEVLRNVSKRNFERAMTALIRLPNMKEAPIKLLIDTDLAVLKTDIRWDTLVKLPLFEQYAHKNKCKNPSLAFELELMLLANQAILETDSSFWKDVRPFTADFIPQKENMKTLNEQQRAYLTRLLEGREKLPDRYEVPIRSLAGLSLVIKHSNDLAYQKVWLAKMKAANLFEYKRMIDYLEKRMK